MPEECRSCRAPVHWATSVPPEGEIEKTNPIDHASVGDPSGNLATWRDGQGLLHYRYLRKGEEPGPGEKRAKSHFAVCPDADKWRSKKKGST